jgi:hypothetical protein
MFELVDFEKHANDEADSDYVEYPYLRRNKPKEVALNELNAVMELFLV